MVWRKALLWWGIFFFLYPAGFTSQEKEKPEFPFPVSHYKLKNGLEVILSEDYTLPLVSVVVAYGVGSMNEQPGKTGLAYLLEHMMFQGSQNIGPMQHLSYINKTGGSPNANTKEDLIFFYQTIPSNQLALALWLESDRMKSLDIQPAKLERAREALLDEITQRRASDPYLESLFNFDRLLFRSFEYSHPLLGREEDLRNLTVEEVREFYSVYYIPNNAALSISGNINLLQTKELVAKYFESIPMGKEIPPLPLPQPFEKGEVEESFMEALAPVPAFHLGFVGAPPFTNDYYPLVVLDYLLMRGKSSRLYRRLVRKDNIALSLSGGLEKRGYMSIFKVFATSNTEVMVNLCQRAIFSELNKLKVGLVPEAELQKAKNILKSDYVRRFSSMEERAMFLAETYFSPVSLEEAPGELERYLRVTSSQLTGIVNRYFTPENRVILNVTTR